MHCLLTENHRSFRSVPFRFLFFVSVSLFFVFLFFFCSFNIPFVLLTKEEPQYFSPSTFYLNSIKIKKYFTAPDWSRLSAANKNNQWKCFLFGELCSAGNKLQRPPAPRIKVVSCCTPAAACVAAVWTCPTKWKNPNHRPAPHRAPPQ